MRKTRWLSQEDQRAWRTFMFATKMLFDQFDRDLRQGAAMPTTYYEVLVRLSEAPERRLRMSQLAERSQSSRSHLSHTISSLERLGWVERETCPTDRRGAFAVLTEAGFSTLESAAHVHVESVRTHLFDQLDCTQIEQLRAISEQLLRHLIPLQEAPTAEPDLLDALVPGSSTPAPMVAE